MGGFVYLISTLDESVYKIGVTRNLDNKRLKSLQTGNHKELKMIHHFYSDYPFRLETMLHKKFDLYSEIGEWFKLPSEVVSNFLNICNELTQIINTLSDNPFFMKNIH